MAILKCKRSLVEADWFNSVLNNAFDIVEEIGKEYPDVIVFGVQRPEVPTDDTIINPMFYSFEGVVPFIIDF